MNDLLIINGRNAHAMRSPIYIMYLLHHHRGNGRLILALLNNFLLWQFGVVGSDVGRINEVTLRLARLVLGWVTVGGSTPAAGNLSQSNQPPRSTQPGHLFVGRRNEYRSKGGDALRLGSKGRYGVVCR